MDVRSGRYGQSQKKENKKAWKEHTDKNKLLGEYTFKQYATCENLKNAESIRNSALNRIEKILSFTDHK